MTRNLVLLILITWAVPSEADVVVPSDRVVTRVVVRESASSASAEVGSLRPGEQAAHLGSVPRWHHVRLADNTDGFVSKAWTNLLPDTAPGSGFSIDVVDVGTGLGILVRGDDFTLLYDGGSNDDLALGADNRMRAYLQEVVPAVTVLDHIILSHPHRDHVELLAELVDDYTVRHVWDSGRLNDICGYRRFLTAVRDEVGVAYHTAVQDFGTRVLTFRARANCARQALPEELLTLSLGSRIPNTPVALGQGASMTFLHADGSNHPSPN